MSEYIVATISTIIKIGGGACSGVLATHFFAARSLLVTRCDIGIVLNVLLLPCLIFTTMVKSMNLEMVLHTYSLLLFSLGSLSVSLFLSKCLAPLIVRLFFPEKSREEYAPLSPLVVACCCYPNLLVLPTAVLESLGHDGTISDINFNRGISYIFIYSVFMLLFTYSYANYIIQEAAEDRKRKLIRNETADGANFCNTFCQILKKTLKMVLSDGVLLSSIAGLVISLTPFLQRIILHQKPFLSVFNSMVMISEGAIPVLLVFLGMSFVLPDDKEEKESREAGDVPFVDRSPVPFCVHAVCISLRLILIPSLIIPCIYLLANYTTVFHFPGTKTVDSIMILVVCLCQITPTGMLTATMCASHNIWERQCTSLLLAMYLCYVLTMSVWMPIILIIAFSAP